MKIKGGMLKKKHSPQVFDFVCLIAAVCVAGMALISQYGQSI